MTSANLSALHRHKYVALLPLQLGELAIQSFSTGGLLSNAVRTVLVVAIFFVVFGQARERVGMAAVLAVFIAIGWGRGLLGMGFDLTLSLVFNGLMALYFGTAVWVILRELFRKPAVGAENVLGSICGYLIAGDAWAAMNAIAYSLMPAAYSISPDVAALLDDWHGRLALFSYYSLAQMLTIGYGDVTPVRVPATTLSLLGALSGVFYTAVVVSQFVGMAQSGRAERRDEE